MAPAFTSGPSGTLVVTVDPAAPAAPTDIALDNASIDENATPFTLVGVLSASDPNANNSAAFSLLDDAGGLFAISNDETSIVAVEPCLMPKPRPSTK